MMFSSTIKNLECNTPPFVRTQRQKLLTPSLEEMIKDKILDKNLVLRDSGKNTIDEFYAL